MRKFELLVWVGFNCDDDTGQCEKEWEETHTIYAPNEDAARETFMDDYADTQFHDYHFKQVRELSP